MHGICSFIGLMVQIGATIRSQPRNSMLQLRVEGTISVLYLCEIKLADVETKTGHRSLNLVLEC